jgi:hypothetical protein
VLVVAPESLMGLVNGSLRMAHRWGRGGARQRHRRNGRGRAGAASPPPRPLKQSPAPTPTPQAPPTYQRSSPRAHSPAATPPTPQKQHATTNKAPRPHPTKRNNLFVRDALRIISLREDFKTARVDGRTLGQLFTGAVEGVMSLRV